MSLEDKATPSTDYLLCLMDSVVDRFENLYVRLHILFSGTVR